MNLLKKSLVGILSTTIISSSALAMNASATPILYADIVYDSTTDTYWANIENSVWISS